MAAPITPYRNAQSHADPQVLGEYEAGSRAVFFLRATAPIFTVALQGHSNRDLVTRSYQPVELEQFFLGSRATKARRGTGLTVTFDVAIAGIGSIAAEWSGAIHLSASIAGTGTVAPNLVKSLTSLASVVAGSGVVTSSLSGGSTAGGLTLDPETGTSLTLTPEASTGETLTGESSDTLTLIPEA